MYKKILSERYILGSQPLNKLSSIKQTTRLYTNYLNNTVIYTVSYAYIIVVNEQRSSAISERFIFGKKTRMSFERITKNAISDTFILESNEFLGMMSENSDQKYAYIGISNGEYIYQVKSKSDTTKEYTIKVKIVNDDHSIQDTRIDIECECLGYKHRGKCWHSDKIRGEIDHNSYCILCLTPFLDIQVKNNRKVVGSIREEVSAFDQDNNEILISKAGNMCVHRKCLINLEQFFNPSLTDSIEHDNNIQEIYNCFKPDKYKNVYTNFYLDDDEAISK